MQNVIRKGFRVRPSKDSSTSKTLVFEARTEGVTEVMLLDMAIAGAIIKAQGTLRKRYADLKDGQTIHVNLVDFAPRGARVDLEAIARERVKAHNARLREAMKIQNPKERDKALLAIMTETEAETEEDENGDE